LYNNQILVPYNTLYDVQVPILHHHLKIL
jgi:hypothetical protein